MGYLFVDDQNLDGNSYVSHVNRRTGVHLNAQLVYEHRVDLTIDPECYVLHDQNLFAMMDVILFRHTSVTDDHSMSGKKNHCVDLKIDPECYVRRDPKMDVNLDVMSRLLMYY